MSEIIAKKTGVQLIIIYGVLLINLIIQFNIWAALRYDNSTNGIDEENMLLTSLISQAVVVPFLIIVTIILTSLAYNNRVAYFSEPGSAMLNICLLLALLACIGSGSVTGYVAYKLQCVELQKTVWLNLMLSTMLSLGVAIFIILVQLSDRSAPLFSKLTRETATKQAVTAIEQAAEPQQTLKELGARVGVTDLGIVQTALSKAQTEQLAQRKLREEFITGGPPAPVYQSSLPGQQFRPF